LLNYKTLGKVQNRITEILALNVTNNEKERYLEDLHSFDKTARFNLSESLNKKKVIIDCLVNKKNAEDHYLLNFEKRQGKRIHPPRKDFLKK